MCLNEIRQIQAATFRATEVAHHFTTIAWYWQGSFIIGILDDVFIHHIWRHIYDPKQDHEKLLISFQDYILVSKS